MVDIRFVLALITWCSEVFGKEPPIRPITPFSLSGTVSTLGSLYPSVHSDWRSRFVLTSLSSSSISWGSIPSNPQHPDCHSSLGNQGTARDETLWGLQESSFTVHNRIAKTPPPSSDWFFVETPNHRPGPGQVSLSPPGSPRASHPLPTFNSALANETSATSQSSVQLASSIIWVQVLHSQSFPSSVSSEPQDSPLSTNDHVVKSVEWNECKCFFA